MKLMNEAEIQRIAKQNNMNESDVRRLSDAMTYARLSKIANMIMADKSNDHVVEFEDCDQVHNDEGY